MATQTDPFNADRLDKQTLDSMKETIRGLANQMLADGRVKSQVALSRASKISPTNVSFWLRSKKELSFDSSRRMLKALGYRANIRIERIEEKELVAT